MSTQKQLPDNLKQLEQKPRFKQVYKQHTVEQLEEKLIEAEVEYGSDENKAALVWRFMDAKGMDFDNQDNDQPARHDEPAEQPQDEKNATNDVPAEQTPQADDSKTGDNADDSEQPSESTDQAGDAANDKPVDDAATGSDDHADAKPPVSANDNSAPTGNGRKKEQPARAAGKQDDKQDDKPAAQYVEVTNNGAYNFYETATGTMIKARQTAKVYTTATIDKAQILRNIEQYNHTRGNKLHVKK
ncbi:hypothetical protein [uncultured Psychrobacter sp.]|uniref:hypothetical protein n=1 Tax=uncultured Psychrobacter sp. TaxID=259303 RepID=UPI002594B655|nr:hypothetical protein [uncultured Psychrobacter sp.]